VPDVDDIPVSPQFHAAVLLSRVTRLRYAGHTIVADRHTGRTVFIHLEDCPKCLTLDKEPTLDYPCPDIDCWYYQRGDMAHAHMAGYAFGVEPIG
jgi:hypothetical protein